MYEISYTTMKSEGKKFVNAENEPEALRKFVDMWEEFGDKWSGEAWVSACWSVDV